MRPESVSRLTAPQKEALRLVERRLQLKEVALALGLTPSAVRERLRAARKTLDVNTSLEASYILARHEGRNPYTSHVDTPDWLADDLMPRSVSGPGPESNGLRVEEAEAVYSLEPIRAHVERPSLTGELAELFRRFSYTQHVALALVGIVLMVVCLLGAASILRTATELHRAHLGLPH